MIESGFLCCSILIGSAYEKALSAWPVFDKWVVAENRYVVMLVSVTVFQGDGIVMWELLLLTVTVVVFFIL